MSLTSRIVVIGASGQLGSDLMGAFSDCAPSGVDHRMVDIEHPASVAAMIARYKPSLILNTAAFHNVELCEMRSERAFAVNAVAVDQLAGQCEIAGIPLVHVSTDYVFDGLTHEPYCETDTAKPVNVYGISKLAGEQLVRRRTARHFIVRTSGLYGLRGSSTKGYTFIERMLAQAAEGKKISVVDDITFSPSYTRHVAACVRRIVENGSFGTFHVTNSGQCTWLEFAREIFRQAGLSPEVLPVSADVFPTYAVRPPFSALRHAAMLALGLPPAPPWQDGVHDYLAERKAAASAG